MNLPLDYLLRQFVANDVALAMLATTSNELLEHIFSRNYVVIRTEDTFILLDKARREANDNYLLSAIEDTNEAMYRAASVAAAFVPHKETTWEDL